MTFTNSFVWEVISAKSEALLKRGCFSPVGGTGGGVLNKVEGVRGGVFQMEGVCFKWRGGVSNGGGAFQLEGVCFKWRGCVSTGGGAFQLEGVCFNWRGCVSTGGGVFHMERVCFKWRGCDAC